MAKRNNSDLASLEVTSNQSTSNPPVEKPLIIKGKYEDIPASPYLVRDLPKHLKPTFQPTPSTELEESRDSILASMVAETAEAEKFFRAQILNGKDEEIPAAPYDGSDLSIQSAQQRLEFLQADKRQTTAQLKQLRLESLQADKRESLKQMRDLFNQKD